MGHDQHGAEIATLDATGQAALVRDGEVSAAELVEGAIERIERLNPVLGAVVTTLYDQARAAVAAGVRRLIPAVGNRSRRFSARR